MNKSPMTNTKRAVMVQDECGVNGGQWTIDDQKSEPRGKQSLFGFSLIWSFAGKSQRRNALSPDLCPYMD
jgi:hypothetical protein